MTTRRFVCGESSIDVIALGNAKLVVNCFVNPISALLQCKNGDVLSSSHSRWILEHLCKEAEQVFRAQLAAEVKEMQTAYEEMNDEEKAAVGPPRPQPYPRALSYLSLMKEVERVVDLTKENYSSMYWDVKLGQPTEIKYLNGYIRKLGQKYGVKTAINDILFGLTQMRTAIPFVVKPS